MITDELFRVYSETVISRLQLVLDRNSAKSPSGEETLIELGAGIYVDAQV